MKILFLKNSNGTVNYSDVILMCSSCMSKKSNALQAAIYENDSSAGAVERGKE
jgi:hypothetical protein